MDDFAHARLSEDEPKNPFDLKVLVLYAAARFRRQIVGLAVLGGFLGLIAGAAQPNIYSVNAKLIFKASARQSITEENVFGVEMTEFRGRMSAAIEEELELLKDPTIYERVVEQIGAEEILRVADPQSGDNEYTSAPARFMHRLQAGLIHLKGLDDPCPGGVTPEAREAAMNKLIAGTKLTNVRRTNIINVVYKDSSPAKAKTIGDEIVRQMRSRHLEQFQAEKQLLTLQGNKDDVLQALTKARKEAAEFKQQCGFWDVETDFTACQEQIRENTLLESRLEQDRQRLLGTVSSLEEELGLRSGKGSLDDENQALNPEYISLQSDLAKVYQAIQAIERRPNIGTLSQKELDKLNERRELLSAKLAETDRYGASSALMSLTADANEAVTNTQTLLSDAKGQLQGVILQMDVVRDQIKDLQQKRQTMEECRVDHMRLEANVQTLNQKYQQITASERTLSSLAIMDQEEVSNLAVFRSTRLPKDKDGPQRSKPLMMGFAGGFAFALGLAVLRQLLERRVRYAETIENQLGLRVLCSVPDLSHKPGFKGAAGTAVPEHQGAA